MTTFVDQLFMQTLSAGIPNHYSDVKIAGALDELREEFEIRDLDIKHYSVEDDGAIAPFTEYEFLVTMDDWELLLSIMSFHETGTIGCSAVTAAHGSLHLTRPEMGSRMMPSASSALDLGWESFKFGTNPNMDKLEYIVTIYKFMTTTQKMAKYLIFSS